ncbi:MAG: hypothetical protein OEM51_06300 [Gammaproteobacteria bacterium]|nr:hypothetical protein [Gammaproteobacteria bacterium]
MNKALIKSAFTVGLLAMLLVVPVYGASVNKSIRIDAGSEADGATTVNGSVSVGEGAVVSGSLETVNGKIRVDDDATIEDAQTVNGSLSIADGVRAEDLTTVNGAIRVGANSIISGEVDAVNGSIMLAKGSKVAKDVGNVNGSIELQGSVVGGNVSTVSGDVDLSDAAVIEGDLIIEKPNSWGWGNNKSRVPKVIIGPGSEVRGSIKLEREVELYISDTAKVAAVEGAMAMNDAVRFSGKRP